MSASEKISIQPEFSRGMVAAFSGYGDKTFQRCEDDYLRAVGLTAHQIKQVTIPARDIGHNALRHL